MRLLIVIALGATMWGCAHGDRARTTSTAGGEAVPDGHNARNALDWSGTYEGVTPCADCPGIRMRLVLHEDETYRLELVYLERAVEPFVEEGSFTWLADGNTIELDGEGGGQRFFVSENRVILLGADGARPTGELADHYQLWKVDPEP